MNAKANLTSREKEIAELFAWGATKKEVALHLFISERTVENHARNIYEKTGCNKVNELSAWWFCFRFRIPMTLSPLARGVIASLILAVYVYGAVNDISTHQIMRISSPRLTTRVVRSSRKDNQEKIFVA